MSNSSDEPSKDAAKYFTAQHIPKVATQPSMTTDLRSQLSHQSVGADDIIYSRSKLTLRFNDPAVERKYVAYATPRRCVAADAGSPYLCPCCVCLSHHIMRTSGLSRVLSGLTVAAQVTMLLIDVSYHLLTGWFSSNEGPTGVEDEEAPDGATVVVGVATTGMPHVEKTAFNPFVSEFIRWIHFTLVTVVAGVYTDPFASKCVQNEVRLSGSDDAFRLSCEESIHPFVIAMIWDAHPGPAVPDVPQLCASRHWRCSTRSG